MTLLVNKGHYSRADLIILSKEILVAALMAIKDFNKFKISCGLVKNHFNKSMFQLLRNKNNFLSRPLVKLKGQILYAIFNNENLGKY